MTDVPPRPDPLAAQEADMCPNCVTPWKCNGPHVPPRSATPEPRRHGPNDGCGELLWEHMSAEPSFDEELRQAEAEIAEGRGIPFEARSVPQSG